MSKYINQVLLIIMAQLPWCYCVDALNAEKKGKIKLRSTRGKRLSTSVTF